MQGMQAWDENGNIVVDIGDFSTRFVGRYRVHIPNGGNNVFTYIPGINGTNSFAAIMWTEGSLQNSINTEYAAITTDNGFKVMYLPGDDIQGEINNLQQAIADETQARTQAIQNLDSKFNTENGKTNASVKTVSDALATEKSSTAQRFSDVNAKVDGLEKSTNASVKRLDEAIASETEARSQQYTGLNATVTKNNTDINKKVDDKDAAINKKVNDNNTAINNKVDANYTQLNTAIANEREARTQAVTRLESSIGSNSAAIEQKLDSWVDANSTGAMYGVKLGMKYKGNYYQAGMNMQLVGSGNQMKSQILFQADRFVIFPYPDREDIKTIPFLVDGDQVYMQSALIKDGSITNAKIGNEIKSNNFVWDQQGWGLSKEGWFQMNGQAGGGRALINQNGVQVFDGNNRLRVRLGLW